MRILLLTLLFIAPIYYFQHQTEVAVRPEPSIDSIKLKMGAPNREANERLLTRKEEVVDYAVEETQNPAVSEVAATTAPEEFEDQVEEVQLLDLEEGWNNELRHMLGGLEPDTADQIHQAYLSEQAGYQAEYESLLTEKSQKTTEEASFEIEQMITQLDQSHQYRMREILGAHYEAVRDHYEDFMDQVEARE